VGPFSPAKSLFFFRVCKILIKCQASTYSTYHRCMYSCPSIMSDTDNTKLVRIIESILAPTKQVLPLIVRANLAHELVTKIAHHISTQTQPSRAISLSSQPLQRLIRRSRFVRIQNTKRSCILHLSCNSPSVSYSDFNFCESLQGDLHEIILMKGCTDMPLVVYCLAVPCRGQGSNDVQSLLFCPDLSFSR